MIPFKYLVYGDLFTGTPPGFFNSAVCRTSFKLFYEALNIHDAIKFVAPFKFSTWHKKTQASRKIQIGYPRDSRLFE